MATAAALVEETVADVVAVDVATADDMVVDVEDNAAAELLESTIISAVWMASSSTLDTRTEVSPFCTAE